MYRTLLAAALSLALACAQTPKFEVASVKLCPPGKRPGGIRPSAGGDRYIADACPLRLMLQVAYRMRNEQISGGPGWLDTDLWDIQAKAEKPSTSEELHVMLQDLLVERFQLKFHREKKEMAIYALTVDKGGPKFQKNEAKSAGDIWIDVQQPQFLHMKWHATFAPMDFFAWRLALNLDRPVVDMTDLKGVYDFDLNYTRDLPPNIPEGAQLNGQPIDTSGLNIFEALKQQLGLKLERQKGPVETIVLEHVEKAAEN